MWSGERTARAGGEYYRVAGIHPGPTPSPSLGIWLGAYGPRMLKLTGARADGWMPSLFSLGLDRLGDAVARVDEAAARRAATPVRSARSTTSTGSSNRPPAATSTVRSGSGSSRSRRCTASTA
ncbi:LLM class flavin-dependent oxidoreductase [Streptomyces diastatochromogenes]|nr:LLM class flavin-dependent oxidoreductase [Streptomyces diastatochromogenes]